MLREPFSWLKSKFFWMNDHLGADGSLVLAHKGDARNNRRLETMNDRQKKRYKDSTFVKCDDEDQFSGGWAKQAALEYIFYLCGVHCMGQWMAIEQAYSDNAKLHQEKHLEYLKTMEEQAAYNLRNSFAVVGLLHQTGDYYDMISKRVAYMDTTLNPAEDGETHSSGRGPEIERCSNVLKGEAFQERMIARSPEVAVMVRLYKLGVEVNKFQKEELESCFA